MSAAGESLRRLILAYEGGTLSPTDFCDQFETAYNLETDRASLTQTEADAFRQLFEVVIWFSPFADEREAVSNYIGPEEIARAVRAASAKVFGA